MELRKNTESQEFRKAILRASGDEPIIRYVAVNVDGSIMVRSEKSLQAFQEGKALNDWIGCPPDDIYLFDPEVYDTLAELQREQRYEDLKYLWGHSQKFFKSN